MRELKFAEEPFDFKLFILCFMKRIGIVICVALAGLLLAGGGHYSKTMLGKPQQYEAATTYYVHYYADPETGLINQYINEATWKSIMGMDWFADRVWSHAMELGLVPETAGVSRENLSQCVSATLNSDVRIPATIVVTEDMQMTGILNEAAKLAMKDLAEHQTEMLGIEVMDETGVLEKKPDLRLVRACILGALLGAFAACVILSFWMISDDSIRIPETFTYRYGLPMLGVVNKGEKTLSQEAQANLAYRFGKNEGSVFYALESGAVSDKVVPEGFMLMKQEELPEGYEKLRKSDGVLLLVEAGMRNGKEIEHVLHELAVQDCSVKGALLCGGDAKLLKAYYLGKHRKAE